MPGGFGGGETDQSQEREDSPYSRYALNLLEGGQGGQGGFLSDASQAYGKMMNYNAEGLRGVSTDPELYKRASDRVQGTISNKAYETGFGNSGNISEIQRRAQGDLSTSFAENEFAREKERYTMGLQPQQFAMSSLNDLIRAVLGQGKTTEASSRMKERHFNITG